MMGSDKIILLISCLLLITLFSGCVMPGMEESENFNEEYQASNETILKISNENGRVNISSWDGDTVVVNATKWTYSTKWNRDGTDELEKVEIVVTERAKELEIKTIFPPEGAKVAVHMDIMVPKRAFLDFVESSNGFIKVTGTKGDTRIQTSNAPIDVSAVVGNISATTSNGNIVIDDVNGYAEAITSNADIDVRGTGGIGNLQTFNGDIRAEIFDLRDDINIVSGNGNIIIYTALSLNADLVIKTSNADIMVNDRITVNDRILKNERSDGNHLEGRLRDIISTAARWMNRWSGGNHLEGRLGDGGYLMSIETNNGDVKIDIIS
ncbi:hypothetical protein Mpsy_2994 [Methanolobus psychrophilus R15]|nr:hypothetical protein Mpsy_2994 [Methanolobus psychrophilus R15]